MNFILIFAIVMIVVLIIIGTIIIPRYYKQPVEPAPPWTASAHSLAAKPPDQDIASIPESLPPPAAPLNGTIIRGIEIPFGQLIIFAFKALLALFIASLPFVFLGFLFGIFGAK